MNSCVSTLLILLALGMHSLETRREKCGVSICRSRPRRFWLDQEDSGNYEMSIDLSRIHTFSSDVKTVLLKTNVYLK